MLQKSGLLRTWQRFLAFEAMRTVGTGFHFQNVRTRIESSNCHMHFSDIGRIQCWQWSKQIFLL